MKQGLKDYFWCQIYVYLVVATISYRIFCTYLSGGFDYQDMHLFAKERGKEPADILLLPNGAPSADTFEQV